MRLIFTHRSEHENLISHDRLPYAQLGVMITGADPKQETSTEGLNTGSQCNRGVHECVHVSFDQHVKLLPFGTRCVNVVKEMRIGANLLCVYLPM